MPSHDFTRDLRDAVLQWAAHLDSVLGPINVEDVLAEEDQERYSAETARLRVGTRRGPFVARFHWFAGQVYLHLEHDDGTRHLMPLAISLGIPEEVLSGEPGSYVEATTRAAMEHWLGRKQD